MHDDVVLILSYKPCIRKALRSLQSVGGLYGMVVPTAEVRFPGQLVGNFVGGETLRAVLPKQEDKGSGSGYGVKFTFDVPENKFIGTLDVRVCWHSIVYRAEVDFGVKNLVF